LNQRRGKTTGGKKGVIACEDQRTSRETREERQVKKKGAKPGRSPRARIEETLTARREKIWWRPLILRNLWDKKPKKGRASGGKFFFRGKRDPVQKISSIPMNRNTQSDQRKRNRQRNLIVTAKESPSRKKSVFQRTGKGGGGERSAMTWKKRQTKATEGLPKERRRGSQKKQR